MDLEGADAGTSISSNADRPLLLLLRLGSTLCFAGWAWGHLYWEGPYGVLIWQDSTYEFAESLGMGWDEFVGSGADDGFVQKWIGRIGWLYLACAVVSLTAGRKSRTPIAALLGGSGLLVFLSYAKYVAAQRQLPMFVEHGGQILMPAILVLALALGARHRITIGVAITALVLTFAGHGSYALGLWPTPATFHAMISVSLGVQYETAQFILRRPASLISPFASGFSRHRPADLRRFTRPFGDS